MARKKQQNMAAAGPVQGLWDVPTGWIWKRLGEVAQTASGGTPSRKNTSFFTGSIPWVKSGELNDGIVRRCEEYITEEALKKSSAKIFKKGTLCIALYGATVGKLGILGIDAATNQAVCAIFTDIIDRSYLYYYLLFKRKTLINMAQGGAQPNISQTILAELPISYPVKTDEQQRIVARIEELFAELDKAEEALQSALLLCGYYRQAMLRDAVSGELSKEWRKAHPPRESGEQLLQRILTERRAAWEASELKKMAAQGKKPTNDSWKKKYKEPQPPNTAGLPELPEGWCWASIPQVALVFNGKTPNGITEISESDGEYRWFRVSDMNANGNELIMKNGGLIISKEILHELCLQLLPSGTIVFPKRGGAIATNKKRILAFDAAIDLNLMGLCPITCYKRYFYTWFSSINLKKISNGSNVPQINNPDIDKVILPIPQANEAELIANIITELFSEIDEVESICQRELNSCKELRQSILNAAFTGKL